MLKKILNADVYYWKSLPVRSYLKLLLSVFFLFSIIGFVNDLFYQFESAVWKLIVDVVIAGLYATVWVYCFTLKKYKLLAVVVFIQIMDYLFYAKLPIGKAETVDIQSRLILDGVGILFMLILGFIFLINFILTGGLTTLSRNEAQQLIKDEGGKITSSVSKTVDFVLVGENPGSKYDKAKKLNLKFISEEEFKKMIGR